ncbi:CoA transferase subunit A [Micromonospora sp. U21]|uniref:CoA transferase subunit A n=1 Tax=Micromonospora sp. U21 TaxID=2824899 RepID=UPI001B39A114|nr:3-oxoacid CoA-transferase subunit A [Micromonospora sp. U21]MBQ0905011.1 3-oxoacid CoA-transferase subunit A [Micromonospora sp. U21]
MTAVADDGTMLSKVMSVEQALAPIADHSTVMVGGFGGAGTPVALREALALRQLRHLTMIANNSDFGSFLYPGGIERVICSFPVGHTAPQVLAAVEAGDVELQLVPQGTLAERIRAAGAGLGGVLTPTGLDMEFGAAYQAMEFNGRRWLLVPALPADAALIKGAIGDTRGNIVCRYAGINFNPVMAMAARYTVAQVERVVPVGEVDPQAVTIPSVLVDAVVELPTKTAEG